MPTAPINDTTIFFETTGVGPPCFVLHGGLGLDHTPYRAFDRLADRFHLVYPDHRHNGRSGRPPLATITMPQLADDVVALADHLHLESFTVIGHSYGGFVAQELALRHPDRVDALILCSTTPGQLGTDEQPPTEPAPPIPDELADRFAAMPTTDDEMRHAFAALTRHYVHRADPEIAASELAGAILDAAAARRGFEVLASWSASDRLHEITCPTLVAVGRFDVVTAWPQALRIVGRVPGAVAVIFEESSHLVWLDEPDLFFDTLGAWSDRFVLGARPERPSAREGDAELVEGHDPADLAR